MNDYLNKMEIFYNFVYYIEEVLWNVELLSK